MFATYGLTNFIYHEIKKSYKACIFLIRKTLKASQSAISLSVPKEQIIIFFELLLFLNNNTETTLFAHGGDYDF